MAGRGRRDTVSGLWPGYDCLPRPLDGSVLSVTGMRFSITFWATEVAMGSVSTKCTGNHPRVCLETPPLHSGNRLFFKTKSSRNFASTKCIHAFLKSL